MLNTVEFGWIRIVEERPMFLFDTLIGLDLAWEWEFWQLAEDGEIVAYWLGNDD